MSNKRIYYAVQNVALGGKVDGTASPTIAEVGGLQSVGINTSFTIDPTYQMGQLSSYYLTEGVPEIEVTLSKVIDGRLPMYLQACGGDTPASNKTLAELQNARSTLQLSIFNDLESNATGIPISSVSCTGMYVSSISYNLTNDGNFTEELTLVGNHKQLSAAAPVVTTVTGEAPVAQRWAFNKATSVLPASVGGSVVLNSASASVSLGRESIFVLGQRTPYHRYATFPVEVTSEFQVLAQTDDGVAADVLDNSCSGSSTNNTTNEEIKLVICKLATAVGENDSYSANRKEITVDLGKQNRLTSVNYSGGDTGGGNATITYSYRNYNDFKVKWGTGA